MHGVFIENGVMDWQIVQHDHGAAILNFSGTYIIPVAAIDVGVKTASPMIRVMREDDNSQLIPWTKTNYSLDKNMTSGTWDIQLSVPAGGLYRIETGLDTISTTPDLGWIFRGDIRSHIGVGDLFVIAGQSNSSGYGRDSAYDPPMPLIHLYRNRRTWDLCSHPMNESTFAADDVNAEMGVSGVSPYLSFGKSLHKLSHYPVGFISTALGGSPISRWNSLQDGDLFANMMTKIKECGGKVAGILWYQGCSDTTPELADTYFESFKHFVMETRSQLAYEVPFFTFQLNRQLDGEYDDGWGIVREAQRQASLTIPSVYILPTLNCTLSDGIHNNAHSYIMLGERMAKICGYVLYNTPKFLAPELAKITYEDDTIKLHFNHIRRSLLVSTSKHNDLGFLIQDDNGIVPIASIKASKDEPNILLITLERSLSENATISHGWEANPTFTPVVDEVSYIPIVSFYKQHITS